MYQLVSAIAKPLSGNNHWTKVNIGNVALNVLFSTYAGIWATLSNPFLTAPVALDLNTIRDAYGGESITFNQFLTSLGNAALETTNTIPQIKPRYAKYQDAIRAGYKVVPTHPSYAPDALVPETDKTWLYMTRPRTDYMAFYKTCLVNVNGYFHLTDASTQGIYVVDGMKSARIARENQIGFVSFGSFAKIECVPITASMVYKKTADQVYKDRAYLDIKRDITGKKVFLILGGYFHAMEPGFHCSRTGDTTFMVDFSRLPLMERIVESMRYIDLSSLNLSTTSRNEQQVAVSEMTSDAAILAYLTLSQSFFVLIDETDLFIDLSPLPRSNIPDIFVTDEKPIYPMFTGVGRLANYWHTFESGLYVLNCTDTLRPNPLYHKANPAAMNSISDQRVPAKPYDAATAFFLKIGTDLA